MKRFLYTIILPVLAMIASCATPQAGLSPSGGSLSGYNEADLAEFHDQLQRTSSDSYQLVERRVRANRHKYRPGHGFKIRGTAEGFALYFHLPISAWYSPTENAQGENNSQWNKLGGISMANWWPLSWHPPNKSAALVAFRPSFESGKFEIAAYVNHEDRSWDVEILATVEPDEDAVVFVNYQGEDEWRYQLYQEYTYGEATMSLARRVFQYNVGPWFGGQMKALHSHSIYTHLIIE